MVDLPVPVQDRVRHSGWVPIEYIGQGGGAKVYLCANADYIATIQKLMCARGVRSDPATSTWEAGNVLKRLSNGLVHKKDALAALKVPSQAEDITAFVRLKKQIEAMSATHHSSLIRLCAVDDNDPPEWFVMEWHPNGNLTKFISQYNGQIAKTITAMLPIVEALAAVHANGFGHHNIKPSNIFMSDQAHLVLGDLGIAFPTRGEGERLTEPNSTSVSWDWVPDWMRFRDWPLQPKVDVFMLAKVIYFMVTGGQNVLATQLGVETFDLRYRLKDVEGAVDLQELLLDCITTKESECKFTDAKELFDRLQVLRKQLTGSVLGSLLFSFLSVHSTTHVPISKSGISKNSHCPSLTNLKVFLPNKCRTFHARVRVDGPSNGTRFNLFLQVDNRHLTSAEGYPFRVTTSHAWTCDIVVTLSDPVRRGWHDLDVTIISDSDGWSVTGFMLYGE